VLDGGRGDQQIQVGDRHSPATQGRSPVGKDFSDRLGHGQYSVSLEKQLDIRDPCLGLRFTVRALKTSARGIVLTASPSAASRASMVAAFGTPFSPSMIQSLSTR